MPTSTPDFSNEWKTQRRELSYFPPVLKRPLKRNKNESLSNVQFPVMTTSKNKVEKELKNIKGDRILK